MPSRVSCGPGRSITPDWKLYFTSPIVKFQLQLPRNPSGSGSVYLHFPRPAASSFTGSDPAAAIRRPRKSASSQRTGTSLFPGAVIVNSASTGSPAKL